MQHVTGCEFEPTFIRYRMLTEKRYRPALRRMRGIRYARRADFATPSAALEYARAWAERSNRLAGNVLIS
jgi:hypothetical protein